MTPYQAMLNLLKISGYVEMPYKPRYLWGNEKEFMLKEKEDKQFIYLGTGAGNTFSNRASVEFVFDKDGNLLRHGIYE